MFFQEKKIVAKKIKNEKKKKKERKKGNRSMGYQSFILRLSSFESTEEARVALDCASRLKQLLRFSRALQTSHVHP